jgi:hypothetical protein
MNICQISLLFLDIKIFLYMNLICIICYYYQGQVITTSIVTIITLLAIIPYCKNYKIYWFILFLSFFICDLSETKRYRLIIASSYTQNILMYYTVCISFYQFVSEMITLSVYSSIECEIINFFST